MYRKRKMNMRVTKAEVIKTASDMADRNGLHNVSLKAIAENLGIRTPSLYNHIGSLDELLREIAHSGMRTMNEKMIRAAIGKTGDSALKLVAVEYLNYMIEHPGVYEIIQWASWNGTEETAIIFNDYLSLLKTLICSCGFNPDKTTEILSMVTGMLHGYTTLQLRYAFSNPDKVRKELSEAIDTLLLGANQKYKDYTKISFKYFVRETCKSPNEKCTFLYNYFTIFQFSPFFSSTR